MTPSPPASTPAEIRAAVVARLDGFGLHIEHRPHELLITNPRDPEKGQVCISLEDGFVSWERTVTDYWGNLEGITTHDQDTRTVPISKIIEALTGHP
jgi:hypothetical protein